MTPAPLPLLPTLLTKPSWHNKAGHVDRSACVEIRVSEVRRMAGCVRFGWERDTKGYLVHRWVESRLMPREQAARNSSGREAAGLFHMDLKDVEERMRKRAPQRLEGDFRTERANAMRGSWTREVADAKGVMRIPTRFRGRPQGPGTEEPVLKDGRRVVAANPNCGATREKMLTLDLKWQQPVRMERWRQRNSILPFYYLVCPGPMGWWTVPGAVERAEAQARGGRSATPQARDGGRVDAGGLVGGERWLGEDDPRCAGLSTIALGAKTKGCPQRVLFLMMPLATAEELADAAAAQAWLWSLTPGQRRERHAEVHEVVMRYGLLFEPRAFVCRRCVGVRYGEDPEGSRQRAQLSKKRRWLPLRRREVLAC